MSSAQLLLCARVATARGRVGDAQKSRGLRDRQALPVDELNEVAQIEVEARYRIAVVRTVIRSRRDGLGR